MACPNMKDVISKLLRLMLENNYTESLFRNYSVEIEYINDKCKELASEDNIHDVIENNDGRLCSHYPPSILVPRPLCDLYQLILDAKFARSRSRFVIPSFSFRGKPLRVAQCDIQQFEIQLYSQDVVKSDNTNICRSSTISGRLEIHGRQVANIAGFTFDGSSCLKKSNDSSKSGAHSLLDRLRDSDCKLLHNFRVTYICDFMIEYSKWKYWLPVTSSEKAITHHRYNDFVIIPLPYPGSEFFKLWQLNRYEMRNLHFDWDRSDVEVSVDPHRIPRTEFSKDIEWDQYKTWDLYTITLNYLKLLLGLIYEGDSGILLHCISGWDRTPLFISLLRCLLWADDLIHVNLSPFDMLYFTLGYDWFLFGHNLCTRMSLGEEIMRFCFQFLQETIECTDLSLHSTYQITSQSRVEHEDNDDQSYVLLKSPSEVERIRKERLEQLTELFFDNWYCELAKTPKAGGESSEQPTTTTTGQSPLNTNMQNNSALDKSVSLSTNEPPIYTSIFNALNYTCSLVRDGMTRLSLPNNEEANKDALNETARSLNSELLD